MRSLSVEEISRKLDERFRLLTGGSRTVLPRQQTLRAALEWSHNLLNDAERAVFRRLSVFAGGFTMELAQAVARDDQLDEWAVLDRLSALVDKSLVVADTGEPPRYRLLESARIFALEHLAEGGRWPPRSVSRRWACWPSCSGSTTQFRWRTSPTNTQRSWFRSWTTCGPPTHGRRAKKGSRKLRSRWLRTGTR